MKNGTNILGNSPCKVAVVVQVIMSFNTQTETCYTHILCVYIHRETVTTVQVSVFVQHIRAVYCPARQQTHTQVCHSSVCIIYYYNYKNYVTISHMIYSCLHKICLPAFSMPPSVNIGRESNKSEAYKQILKNNI